MHDPFFCIGNDRFDAITSRLNGIAYTDGALIYDQSGLAAYVARHGALAPDAVSDGRFSYVARQGDAVTIKSDAFGLDPIFYYKGAGVWAVSNSFHRLVQSLRAAGRPLHLDENAVAAFSLFDRALWTGQIISHQSLVQEIELLPMGKQIVADRHGLRVEDAAWPTHDIPSYDEGLDRCIEAMHRRMIAAAALAPGAVVADLSGGQDSRFVFGLCARSPALRDTTVGYSRPYMSHDLAVARVVAGMLRMPLGTAARRKNAIPGEVAYRLWQDGAWGVYKPVHEPLYAAPPRMMRFTGGNFVDSGYIGVSGEKRIETILSTVAPHLAPKVEAAWRAALLALDPDLGGIAGLEKQYLRQRARLHYGRARLSELQHGGTHITPLLSTELLQALERFGRRKNQIMCDLIYKIDPALVRVPFSTAKSQVSEKNIATSEANVRVATIGDVDRLDVYGTIAAAGEAPAATGGPRFWDIMADAFARATRHPLIAELYAPAALEAHAAGMRKASYTESASAVIAIAELADLVG